jgi:HlyD family secretion protein
MSVQVLPSDFIDASAEQLLYNYSKNPKIIYISVLLLLVGGFCSLFFIYVDVSVKAQGIVKAPGERIYPKASGSGYVQYVNPDLKENAQITIGDTLIIIGRDVWDEQLRNSQERREELMALLSDLSEITALKYKGASGKYINNIAFKTAVYAQNYQLFCRHYENNFQQFSVAKKIYERNKLLFNQQVIASADFEQVKNEYDKTVATLATTYNEQMSQWQTEQHNYQTEYIDLQSKINQLTIQKQELTVIAPVNGSVQQLSGIKTGSYITEGESLMEISPAGAMYAECYVMPRDIGLIQKGQLAFLQIDAFNYNEWGMLQARVSDIAYDVVLPEGSQQPVFKVFCTLERDYMELKTGYRGALKKGMTASVRFTVTRRTLFQLLYDKMDNWLNPNVTV